MKAIACIIGGFDIMRSNPELLKELEEEYFREWIIFLVSESGFDQDEIKQVYSALIDYHNNYDQLKIRFNLKRLHELY